jgi:formylglycine-generating enzyme
MRALGVFALGATVVAASVGSALAVDSNVLVRINNLGNPADTRYNSIAVGSVDYEYSISKFEVTVAQYTEFLNAVAATDTYGLYNPSMAPRPVWGSNITRTGAPGSYQYAAAAETANRPINYVSWGDAARYVNWLSNSQPTGPQALGTTESGSYYLNGATTAAALMAVARDPAATWVLPTEDEWYKAAYHMNDGVTGNYSDYPNGTNSINTGQANYANAVGRATDAGSYGVLSAYGTFDQAGNLWEWNEAVVFGSSRGMRGGSLYSSTVGASNRSGGAANYEADSVGFRIALIPEPASMLLLAFGATGMMLRSRRARKSA